jgi:hypothetical protein
MDRAKIVERVTMEVCGKKLCKNPTIESILEAAGHFDLLAAAEKSNTAYKKWIANGTEGGAKSWGYVLVTMRELDKAIRKVAGGE